MSRADLARFWLAALDPLRALEREGGDPGALRGAARELAALAAAAGLDEVFASARALADASEGAPLDARREELRAALAGAPVPGPAPAADPDAWDAETARALGALFRDEARESIEAAADALAAWERDPGAGGAIDDALRHLHRVKGGAGTVGLPAAGEAAHAVEDRVAALRRSPDREPATALDAALDAALAGLDTLRAMVDLAIYPGAVRALLAEIGAPDAARPDADRRLAPRRAADRGLARVPIERIDTLLDAAGDVVVARTRVERRAEDAAGVARDLHRARAALASLHEAVEAAGAGRPAAQRVASVEAEIGEVARAVARLREAIAADAEALRRAAAALGGGLGALRTMPLSWLLARAAPAAREAARAEGKRVEVEVEVEPIEIDRALVERCGDVVVQLVRNAVAHGIEPSERRERLGKAPVGRVRVSARRRGDHVVIEVADDGSGLSPDALRAAMVRAGAWSREEAARRTDAEALAAIFTPGLSTRAAPSLLAGRGVGLDAVRAGLLDLGGEIAVDSSPGRGARFRLRLPVARAITQALLCKVSGQVYAVPAADVIETAWADPETVLRAPASGSAIEVRGVRLPLVRLRGLLGGDPPPGGLRRVPLIVLRGGETVLAASCHKLIGPREIVIRPLPALIAGLPLFAGATVSGAGKVQLVLDPLELGAIARGGARARPAAGGAAGAGRGRVLFCDDSRSARQAVALALGQAGFSVRAVEDGLEAWEALSDQPFDLLVTDLEMPRLSGCDLIARCRRDPVLRHLPILVLTARPADPARERALAAGADAFQPKPIGRRALAERVEQVLAARR